MVAAAKARRLAAFDLQRYARRALLALSLVVPFLAADARAEEFKVCTAGDGAILLQACFTGTEAIPYGHGVLGDTPEWTALELHWGPKVPEALGKPSQSSTLRPSGVIFEDIAPRVLQLDSDPVPELIIIHSHPQKGAQIVLLDLSEGGVTQIAGPFIGTRNRWLAPIGAADLDGDGQIEIAYVDRPHLAKTLRVFRWQGNALVPLASLPAVTNHRIGEDFISGGLRDCGDGPRMIVANAFWTEILEVSLQGAKLTGKVIKSAAGPSDFAAALDCR